MFIKFKEAVNQQFDRMAQGNLFVVDVDKDLLLDAYLGAFTSELNPIFRERTQHDCQCCKQFIRAAGGVVSIVDNKLVSIWDVDVPGEYQIVANALSEVVKSKVVENAFFHYERNLGTDHNHQLLESGDTIRFDHFHYKLDKRFVKKDAGSTLSDLKSRKDVFKRGLTEISVGAIETVLELIEQNSLYRGEEHKRVFVAV